MPRQFSSQHCYLALLLQGLRSFAIVASDVPIASPKASSDLICHTTDPADCYPAIFSPTLDFQIVHEDQSIPPGLHVRMNLATGIKEARLNVPLEDDGEESAVVLLDGSEADQGQKKLVQASSAQPHEVQDGEKDTGRTAKYLSKSKYLTTDEDPEAIAAAWSRITTAKPDDITLQQDLNFLLDLAHDAEWGLAIAQDQAMAVRLRQCVDADDEKSYDIDARSAATVLLATALQNNEPALKAFVSYDKAHGSITKAICRALRVLVSESATHKSLQFASRLVFLMAQLCQDDSQLEGLVENQGLELLNKLLALETRDWDTIVRERFEMKVANFVLDYAPRMMKYPSAHYQLVRTCGLFRFDENSRFRTDTPAFRKTMDVHATLQDLLGDECV